MSRGSKVVGILVLVAVAAGLGVVAWQMTGGSGGETCAACSRAVHVHTRTVANLDCRTHTYCCLACAISEYHQTRQPVEVLAINDYQSGESLQPHQAFIVRGSRINHCLDMEPAPRVEDVGHPAHRDFDRCAPGMIAFETRDAAAQFAAKNGGAVLSFSELAQETGLIAAH
jgi:hypothetical protein